MKLIECVPNFSEGQNQETLKQIEQQIRETPQVKLLHVDPGVATNRTVFTFVGEPRQVCQAALKAVCKAAELIDMRFHKGEHPRIGATDVLPLIPISGITLEECAELARELARQITETTGIPTYNYEAAATKPERKNLANVRAGEYEGLPNKLKDPNWVPDFGDSLYNEQVAKSGATIVGARDFLIAVNFNLNTTSAALASEVAKDVRESGRTIVVGEWSNEAGYWSRREGVIHDPEAERVKIPGVLKGCKAIGWYIREYGIAQVSMNITDIGQCSLHEAFEAVDQAAAKRGMRVTGTEIIGLLPLRVLTEAGRYFLRKQQQSEMVSDQELIKIAIKSMGLGDLAPFDPNLRVIEYLI